MNLPVKRCNHCDAEMVPHKRCYAKEWAAKRFCSAACANRSKSRGGQTVLPDGTKLCSCCQDAKSLDSFIQGKDKPSGRSSRCRECINAVRPPRLPLSPEVRKGYYLQNTYGLSLHEYEDMRVRQNGVCAICGEYEVTIDSRTGSVRGLAVDHSHLTDNVRGLLCRRCNVALGGFPTIELLRSALAYIERGGE